MSQTSNKLDFFLGNEISRLENADSYELYILKNRIDECLKARKIGEQVKTNVNPGYSYIYFDKELHQEDVIKDINFDKSEEKISGVRQSDEEPISINYESIDLSRNKNVIKKEATEITNEWDIKYRQKIAIERYVHLGNQKHVRCRLIGYMSKLNHSSFYMRLLSGQSIQIKPSRGVRFYEPTTTELKCFESIESCPKQQEQEELSAKVDFQKYASEKKEPTGLISKNKLHKNMMLRGYDLELVDKIYSEYFPDKFTQQSVIATS